MEESLLSLLEAPMAAVASIDLGDAGSVHVPTVSGGRMLIVYFLPGGELDWLKDS